MSDDVKQVSIPPTLVLPPAEPECAPRSRRQVVAAVWILAQVLVPLSVITIMAHRVWFGAVTILSRADVLTATVWLIPVMAISLAAGRVVWVGTPKGLRAASALQWTFGILVQIAGVLLLLLALSLVPEHDYSTYAPRPPADIFVDKLGVWLIFLGGTLLNVLVFGVPIMLLWPWRKRTDHA